MIMTLKPRMFVAVIVTSAYRCAQSSALAHQAVRVLARP
jgi:hypothetical protein